MQLEIDKNLIKNTAIIFATLAVVCLAGCSGSSSKDFSPKSDIINGVNYVGVSVSNLETSTKFYQTPLDLEVVGDSSISVSIGGKAYQAEARLLRSTNAQVRLMKFNTPSDIPPVEVQGPGIAHVCYQVAKETDAYGKLLEAGASHIGNRDMVQLNPRNPVEYAYAKDLDDIIVEIEHIDIDALDLPAPPTNKYRIRHVSLATPDIDRLARFYSSLLDDPEPRRVGKLIAIGGDKVDAVSGLEGSKLKMAWFQTRNLELEMFQYASHPTSLPETLRPVNALGYNMIIFDVNNVEAIREKFEAAGGTLETDIMPIDDGAGFYGRDPDGNILGFVKSPSTSAYSSQNFSGNGTE